MSDKYPHPYTYYSVIKELDPKSVVQMDTEHDDLSTLVWLDGNPNDITTEQIEAKKQEITLQLKSQHLWLNMQKDYRFVQPTTFQLLQA